MAGAEAGTPDPNADGGGASTGTPTAGQDDGGDAFVRVSKGELKSWKEKAEEANTTKRTLAEREDELATLRARVSAASAPTDPMAAWVADMQERSQYDPGARDALNVLQISAEQKLESALTKEMVKNAVTPAEWDAVERMVKESGYRISVAEARKRARGLNADEQEAELAKLRDENKRMKEALEGGGKGPAAVSGAASTPAAAVSGERATTIAKSQYNAILTRGMAGNATPEERARALQLRSDLEASPPRAVLDWNA